MFPNNIDFFVRERIKDAQDEAEQRHLVKAANFRPLGHGKALQKTTQWIGARLIKLGTRLQGAVSDTLPDVPSIEAPKAASSQN